MSEFEKYQIIKNLVDNGGNKRNAALKLEICVRQIDRLIKKYGESGKSAFVHGNRSRKPINTFDPSLSSDIVQLYKSKYQDCNFSHFKDLLESEENISVSYKTIYNILTNEKIYSPKLRRATKRKLKRQELEANKELTDLSNNDIELLITHRIGLEDSHPRQSKPKYFGEIVEMDGSIHLWFGETKTCLHLAIDLCTGTIVGGFFGFQETLRGYYTIYQQILENYGIPYKFRTDNRTVFNYESLNKSERTSDKDVLTQFGYACRILGTDIETTSVSQAKGTIERANQTFQGRLVQELRIHGINDIDGANRYLIEKFIPNFNKRFALNYLNFESAFETAPDANKINYTLAVITQRKIDNGNSIKYYNKYYQPFKDNKLVCFKTKTSCNVIKAFDNTLLVAIDDEVFELVELQKHQVSSSELDHSVSTEVTPKKKYIPPMTHPWRQSIFQKHVKKAHSSHVYA